MQQLNPEQKMQRVQFAEWVTNNIQETDIIVFSDESRFSTGSDCQYVRFRNGEWNHTACREMAKFHQSVMYWRAIAMGFRSRLMKCSNHMDSAEYTRILGESGIVEELNAKFTKYKSHS